MSGLGSALRRLWALDAVRLLGLTVYYLAIIAGVARLHGARAYRPPPFVYQAF